MSAFDPVIPQHLERPREGVQSFGTLRQVKDKGQRFWEITGDAQAVLMAKRLFPGAEGRGPGIAKFPAIPRIFQDLVWFMHRYPLRIEDPACWEEDYQASCRQVLDRMALNANPVRSLPAPEFKGTLRPFQEEGLSWLLTNRRTLLADEMGLGKTPTALAFLATMREWPALIVVPPHLVTHWEDKCNEFLEVATPDSDLPLFAGEGGLKVHTIRGLKPYELPRAHVYIIHYLLLRAWRETLKASCMAAVIYDEVQDLRHTGTEKYSAASDLSSRARSVIGLSGTPIYNYGAEIWNVMNAIDYHCLGDFDSFSREWCDGYGHKRVKDTALLHEYLKREGLMLRRKKEDVLKDLPPKRRVIHRIENDDEVFSALIGRAIAAAKEASDAKTPFERGRLELEALKETRRATGLAKAPAVAAFVRGLMEAEEPTLLFAYHHDVVDSLRSALDEFNPVCITGREDKDQKAASVEAFRKGASNLVIISLRAATGIDGLQDRARVVVFAELDWSPAIHSQGEDRAHRMGQADSVLAYYLVTGSGTDPEMQEALGLKVSQFVGLMGDRVETEEERVLASAEANAHMRRVIEKLRAMDAA